LFFKELDLTRQKSSIEAEISSVIQENKIEIGPQFVNMMNNTIRLMHLRILKQTIPENQISMSSDFELGITSLHDGLHHFLTVLLSVPFHMIKDTCEKWLKRIEHFTGSAVDRVSKEVFQIPSSLENNLMEQFRYIEMNILPKVGQLGAATIARIEQAERNKAEIDRQQGNAEVDNIAHGIVRRWIDEMWQEFQRQAREQGIAWLDERVQNLVTQE
jgi:hypothetical protein